MLCGQSAVADGLTRSESVSLVCLPSWCSFIDPYNVLLSLGSVTSVDVRDGAILLQTMSLVISIGISRSVYFRTILGVYIINMSRYQHRYP